MIGRRREFAIGHCAIVFRCFSVCWLVLVALFLCGGHHLSFICLCCVGGRAPHVHVQSLVANATSSNVVVDSGFGPCIRAILFCDRCGVGCFSWLGAQSSCVQIVFCVHAAFFCTPRFLQTWFLSGFHAIMCALMSIEIPINLAIFPFLLFEVVLRLFCAMCASLLAAISLEFVFQIVVSRSILFSARFQTCWLRAFCHDSLSALKAWGILQ